MKNKPQYNNKIDNNNKVNDKIYNDFKQLVNERTYQLQKQFISFLYIFQLKKLIYTCG